MPRACIPVLLLAASIGQAQQGSIKRQPAGGISVPAELTTTIRAERAHRGDPVEFRTLEAVLISNGLVMPANARLSGRIVGAAPRQQNKPSWLVLLVERGEWKTGTVPLHAFISAQLSISRVPLQNSNPPVADTAPTTISPRRVSRGGSARAVAENGFDAVFPNKLPQDASEVSQEDSGAKPVVLKDLRIVRDKDGIAYLFCTSSNIKLPSGTFFVLQNQPTPERVETGTDEKLPATQHPQP
jgi:hypothetical protein